MRDNYDFSNAIPNPYIGRVKKPITLQVNISTISYFKDLAKRTGIPYQNLINLFLTQCAKEKKEPKFT